MLDENETPLAMTLATTLVDITPIYKNFAGKASAFNPPGRRSFGLELSDAKAEELEAEGWSVKHPRRPNGERTSMLPVSLNPHDYIHALVTLNGRDCDTDRKLSLLDKRNDLIGNVELIGYRWNFEGKTGVKAYLKSLDLKSIPRT